MLNKKYGPHSPHKLATIPVSGEGKTAGLSFADDVEGANTDISCQGDGGPRSGGRGLAQSGRCLR